jgi:ABC-2 type transport system ATP-binding protein
MTLVFDDNNGQEQIEETESRDFIIRTWKLAKEFNGAYAVRNVTFDLPRGKIFGFIGPSGSGKTTTIRMLTGFYEPSAGDLLVFDRQPMKFTKSMRARIGYMPQLFVLYPNLSVMENLNFAASIYGMSYARGKQMKEVLDFVELSGHQDKLAREISGGMQRRLSLAATLVHDPELVFLDEPTAGVDPVLRQKFWDHFRELKEAGVTLFITTQYVSEAVYCDLVGVIDEGVLIDVDTPEGLRQKAYGGDMVDLRTAEPLTYQVISKFAELPFVKKSPVRTGDKSVRLTVSDAGTDIAKIVNWCQAKGVRIQSVDEFSPPFDEVFVKLVAGGGKNE